MPKHRDRPPKRLTLDPEEHRMLAEMGGRGGESAVAGRAIRLLYATEGWADKKERGGVDSTCVVEPH